MNNQTKVFGSQTKQNWIDLRANIILSSDDIKLWEQATDLFQQRIETRYFRPINRILHMRIYSGEGFAVMTLICSLIEFLQSCYEGKSYDYTLTHNDDTKTGYGKSGEMFKRFLIQHEPFKAIFNNRVSMPNHKITTFADDFYSNVRCGLLHEAATNNQWIIKTNKVGNGLNEFIDISNENRKIIYRDNFFEAIKSYCDSYKQKIIDNTSDDINQSIRDNFCRKLDCLCMVDDKTTNWWPE